MAEMKKEHMKELYHSLTACKHDDDEADIITQIIQQSLKKEKKEGKLKKIKDEKSAFEAVEQTVELVLELISGLDMFGDAYIIYVLVKSQYVFLPAVSIIFMTCSLYVCYSPLLHMLLERKTFVV